MIASVSLAHAQRPSATPAGGAALGAVTAVATLSLKTVNQDACAVLDDAASGIAGVIVADGIGSHFHSELSSAAACAAMKHSLSIRAAESPPDLLSAFSEANAQLEADLGPLLATLPEGVSPSQAFGTTLLFAGLSSGALHLGYVGNGAIFHLRGDFGDFPPSRILPWTSLNYLNPHTAAADGGPALYKWLSPSANPGQAVPTIMSVTRDLDLRGDVLVVCSDGVYSYDQVPVGLDSSGRPWISGEESMQLLYAELSSFLREGDLTPSTLQRTLDGYLAKMCERNLVDDDCTIGVVISDTALRYHEQRRLPRE
jgi:serine/threonine protein phosphatase PrpC